MSKQSHTSPPGFVSTKEAAADLGYTIQHTRLLIRQGQLDAVKFGRDWLIVRESVATYKTNRDSTNQIRQRDEQDAS